MAMQVKVGSFTELVGSGSQAITGVGFTPKALILYTASASSGFRTGMYLAVGFSSSSTETRSVAVTSLNGAATSSASRRMAAKALTKVDTNGGVHECDLTSFDADGFTLLWGADTSGTGGVINYIALGGADLTNAKVIQWAPSTSAGDKAVTGIGFKPDCVLHASEVGVGAAPTSFSNAYLSFGVADKDGNQWASSFFSATSAAPSNTSRGQYSDKCIAMVDINDVLWGALSFKSMDADGFTLNQTLPAASAFGNVISLCLKGGSYRVGNFSGPDGPGSKRYDGIGFKPKGLLSSSHSGNGSHNDVLAGAFWNMGASDGTTHKAISIQDFDAQATTAVRGFQADVLFNMVHPTTLADNLKQGAPTSLNDDGFTVNWTQSDGTPRQIGILAFGDTPVSSTKGLKVKVGSFVKSSATGTQAISGVGFQPKALILFSTGTNTANGFAGSPRTALGLSSGASASYAVCAASLNATSPSNASRRFAAKALTLVDWGETLRAECDLTSFDADGFTLNWTTNDTSAFIINYIALGGDDLTNAKAVQWACPTTTGEASVTGVGFKPDCVLHAGNLITAALPASIAHAHFGFGAMDRHGNQWSNAFLAEDALATSNTFRAQRADRCFTFIDNAGVEYRGSSFVRMESDGFRLNHVVSPATADKMISLALKGGSYKVGNFNTISGAGYQSVGGMGFAPKGLLTTNIGLPAQSTPATIAAWTLGAASSSVNQKLIGINDLDNLATTNVDGYQGDYASGTPYDGTLYQMGVLSSFDNNGVTFNWSGTTNPNQTLYLAFGDTVVEDTTQDAGTKVKVGSLVLKSGLGLQQITGLGFRPKALIVYYSGLGSPGFSGSLYGGVGFSAGGGASYAVALRTSNGGASSSSGRAFQTCLVTSINGGNNVALTIDLESFDSDGFTIDIVVNNDGWAGYLFNYIAIGGQDLINAEALQWTTATIAGNQAITGVGFQPDLALHLTPLIASASSSAQMYMGVGAMDKNGGQWANSFASNSGVTPSDTARAQRIDRCINNAEVNGTSIVQAASYVSMNPDGFTINWNTNNGGAYKAASLCLKGPRFKVGSFQSATAVGVQAVTGMGFRPKGLMLSAYGNNASTTPSAHTVWSLGAASSPTDEKGIGIRDQDALATTSTQGYQNDKIISGPSPVTASALDFQGDLSTFDIDGFSINWTTMDTFTEQILYLGMGDAPKGFLQQGGWGFPA